MELSGGIFDGSIGFFFKGARQRSASDVSLRPIVDDDVTSSVLGTSAQSPIAVWFLPYLVTTLSGHQFPPGMVYRDRVPCFFNCVHVYVTEVS